MLIPIAHSPQRCLTCLVTITNNDNTRVGRPELLCFIQDPGRAPTGQRRAPPVAASEASGDKGEGGAAEAEVPAGGSQVKGRVGEAMEEEEEGGEDDRDEEVVSEGESGEGEGDDDRDDDDDIVLVLDGPREV